MTTAYINRTYLETFFTEPQISKLLTYGYNSTTVSASLQNAKLDQLITASSDTIDSFLVNYDLPLPFTPPALAQACSYLVIKNLFAVSQQPLPEQFEAELQSQFGYLNDIKEQRLNLPGIPQNTASGVGGSVFSFESNDYEGNPQRSNQQFFSTKKTWNTLW